MAHALTIFKPKTIAAPEARGVEQHLQPKRDFLAERYELFRKAG